MSKKSYTANLVIECNIQCPKCGKDIDVFEQDDDGALYRQIFIAGHTVDYDVYCEDCKDHFNIDSVEV